MMRILALTAMLRIFYCFFFFFFQAEDGIRDYKVTGVQTCALPISTIQNTLVNIYFITASNFATVTFIHNIAVINIRTDRKSTRLNSSHLVISYAVFCLKKDPHGVDGTR